MDITWDPTKAALNLVKHGVSFSDAEGALWDPYALTVEEQLVDSGVDSVEKRFVTLGMDCLGVLVVVVYMYRNSEIRMISARKATRSEARQYGKRD